MPFVHGRNAAVYFNATDVTTYLNSAAVNVAVDTAETSTFGSTWKSFLPGQIGGTFAFGGLYDPALTQLDSALGVDSGILTFCPGGASAVGDRARMAYITSTSLNTSVPVGDVIGFAWDAMTETAIADGHIVHPLAEDTNTTTGTIFFGPGGTFVGWTAHLHVTAVDGGSWVIRIQDTSDAVVWTDLAGGAFTAATGPTSQRLLSSSITATVLPAIRYIATRTGGSAGDGITFVLAFARTNA